MSGPSDSVSPSPSPSKANTSASGGSAFKSRIAAFESGAAANASKRDQSKQIQHADLSNLRSRFDREGEKPLEVKGSFGLGAAPLRAPGEHGHGAQQGRAVSLGAGRAVAPTQSPLVVLPSPSLPGSSSARSASSSVNSAAAGATATPSSSTTNAARPVSTRSDSTNSASTSATSTSLSGATATSTASSLLPGPLAALRGSAASGASASSSTGGGDDSLSAGLRTPMSSVSLSSMMVETGSIAGEAESSSGDTTANEDERVPVGEKILGVSDDETATTPIEEPTTPGMRADTNEGEDDDSLQLSAAALEKRKALDKAAAASNEPTSENKPVPKKTPSVISEGGRSVDSAQPPKDAVDRAAAELDKYTHEEPSQTAVMSPPPINADANGTASLSSSASVPRLDMPAQEEAGTPQHEPDFAHKLPSPPPTGSARKSPSRPGSGLYTSPTERLKRSSTAGSIHSVASHPESDLADTNLENFDDEAADVSKAAAVADSIAPPPADTRQASDAPIADTQGAVADVSTNADNVPQDDISSVDKQDFAPVNADESVDEVDEEGMPLVKCSDCHAKVSLVKLGEHVCSAPASIPPASASTVAFPRIASGSEGRLSQEGDDTFGGGSRDRRETGPEDVPTSDFSPSPVPSPQMSHRSLASKPDVPDDEAQSVDSMPVNGDEDEPTSAGQALSARPSPARHGTTDSSVAAETDDLEEDYMTALTSRRDSEDMTSNTRPGFMSDLPEPISDPRNLSFNGLSLSDPSSSVGNGGAAEDDDEESEVLAMGMADGPISTPRMGSFSNGSSAQQQRSMPATHPDSPTPDRGSISPTSQTPMSNRTAKLTAPQNADGGMMGAAGVRRRSSATKRNKNLGDTDSENEVEPGTVTIIR